MTTAPGTIAIASPLGFTEGGRYYYRDVYLPALATVVVPVDPWDLFLGASAIVGGVQGRSA